MRDPVLALRRYCRAYPRQAHAARSLGVSPQFLSMMLHARKAVSRRVLAQLGLSRRVIAVTHRPS